MFLRNRFKNELSEKLKPGYQVANLGFRLFIVYPGLEMYTGYFWYQNVGCGANPAMEQDFNPELNVVLTWG